MHMSQERARQRQAWLRGAGRDLPLARRFEGGNSGGNLATCSPGQLATPRGYNRYSIPALPPQISPSESEAKSSRAIQPLIQRSAAVFAGWLAADSAAISLSKNVTRLVVTERNSS